VSRRRRGWWVSGRHTMEARKGHKMRCRRGKMNSHTIQRSIGRGSAVVEGHDDIAAKQCVWRWLFCIFVGVDTTGTLRSPQRQQPCSCELKLLRPGEQHSSDQELSGHEDRCTLRSGAFLPSLSMARHQYRTLAWPSSWENWVYLYSQF